MNPLMMILVNASDDSAGTFKIWCTVVLLNRSSLLISPRPLPPERSFGVTFKRFIVYVDTYMRNSTIVPKTVRFWDDEAHPAKLLILRC